MCFNESGYKRGPMLITSSNRLKAIIIVVGRETEERVDHLFRVYIKCSKAHHLWLNIHSPSHQRKTFSACWSWDSVCRRTSAWLSSSGWEISLLGFAELVVKESAFVYITDKYICKISAMCTNLCS